MYSTTEDEQLLFIEAMHEIQAQSNANNPKAFEDWLNSFNC
jgi:hypothetical protein